MLKLFKKSWYTYWYGVHWIVMPIFMGYHFSKVLREFSIDITFDMINYIPVVILTIAVTCGTFALSMILTEAIEDIEFSKIPELPKSLYFFFIGAIMAYIKFMKGVFDEIDS